VRCVVVEAQVMVYDRVIGVIGFDQVLEGSRTLLGGGFDFVNLDRWEINRLVTSASSGEERW
jgi:hypothetical protein